MEYDRDSLGVKMHHWRIVGQALRGFVALTVATALILH